MRDFSILLSKMNKSSKELRKQIIDTVLMCPLEGLYCIKSDLALGQVFLSKLISFCVIPSWNGYFNKSKLSIRYAGVTCQTPLKIAQNTIFLKNTSNEMLNIILLSSYLTIL